MTRLPSTITTWLETLKTNRRLSEHTLKAYAQDIQHLVTLAKDQALDTLTEEDIRYFLVRLHGQGYQPRSLARMLAAWRNFYEWQRAHSGGASNPTAYVRPPKATQPLPQVLSVDQAKALLDRAGLPRPQSAVEWRDQAMFEVLYSSGLRLAELVSLDVQYIHSPNYTSRSWLQLPEHEAVVYGKGGKTRSLPLGKSALQALHAWLKIRPELLPAIATADSRAALFLGVRGKRIHPRVVQRQLEKLAAQAGLPTRVHPHTLRHSFASHLLQSAQDLRAVQELLGHRNISTTQIYTQLDYQQLAKIYDQAHPRASRKKDNADD